MTASSDCFGATTTSSHLNENGVRASLCRLKNSSAIVCLFFAAVFFLALSGLASADSDDFDDDGVLNASDNCQYDSNADQSDLDGDLVGDVCDPDDDDDGVTDGSDNCPFEWNENQANFDGDSFGDQCDSDDDEDGIDDNSDNCLFLSNPDQYNNDADSDGDACDDNDDNDGVYDTVDNCQFVQNDDQTDTDFDNLGNACDEDDDDDGYADAGDNCPLVANADQANANPADGVGDACDDQWTVSLSVAPASSGTASGAGSNFVDGTYHTITATPNAGFGFVNWIEAGSEVSTDASYSFTLVGDRTLVANFAPERTIALSVAPGGSGSVGGGGTFLDGESRTVHAAPSIGYAFSNWTEGGSPVSTDQSYTSPLEADRTLVAHFVAGDARIERDSIDGLGNESGHLGKKPAKKKGLRLPEVAVSANGRFIVFTSFLTDLVSSDTNGSPDIFVRDRLTGEIERVSVGPLGEEADDESSGPSISNDGRFVAFQSDATNLVGDDTNLTTDIFVRDRELHTTERVSVDSADNEADSFSRAPSISADGRYVAYQSGAGNLVAGDGNDAEDIFVRDRELHTTERVSIDNAGNEASDASRAPSISADGRYIAFYSLAPDLVDSDANGGVADVFLHDRQDGTTILVSVDSGGNQGDASSFEPSISADARSVAFNSVATNLVAGDTNGARDVFVRDLQTGETERASVDSSGAEGDGQSDSYGNFLSADGRTVSFFSNATNLVPDDTNLQPDVFIHDRQTGATERLSVNDAGGEGDAGGELPSISANGLFVGFTSYSTNLVIGDTNNKPDIFLRGLPGFTISLSADPAAGGTVDGEGTFATGGSQTVTATANTGYHFVNWTEGGTLVNTGDSYVFVLNANRTLVAHFAADDTDNDGIPDSSDNCPVDANADQANNDGDGQGDACDADDDNDTIVDAGDNCPVTSNPDQLNTDGDAQGNVCDADDDNDTIVDTADNCPVTSNPDQLNTDGDAQGDVCDTDDDNDTIVDTADNCPLVANPNQANANPADGVGDACDDKWKLTLSASPAAGGTVTGGGVSIVDGTSRTVVATAKPNYEFARWTQGGVLASNTASYTFSLTANRTLVAQFRVARRRNDLLADFGSGGLQRFLNNTTWTTLHTASPVAIAAGDLDGNGKDEAIASFSGGGLVGLYARYNNGTSWTKLDSAVPARLAVGDFDGNGKDDLAADFGAGGIKVLRNNTKPFVSLNLGTSQGLATGDLDGGGRDELLADRSDGLWVLYNNGATWTRINTTSPTALATGDFDGNRKDEVAIGLGASGIYVRSNNAGSFVQVNTAQAQALATGDLDGNGKKELIADLGASGLQARYNNAGPWKLLDAANPLGILAVDLDRTGKADVVEDRGATGLFVRYNNAGAFVRKNTPTSQALAAGGFD